MYPDKSSFIDLKKNSGKAEAVRQGALKALSLEDSCDYVGFMDADLSTPLDEVERFLDLYERMPDKAMLSGARVKGLLVTANVEHTPG